MPLRYANREEYLAARIAKRQKKAARKGYAPERAELRGPDHKPEIPADGIDRFYDELLKHDREICLTPEAMQARREELFARSGGHCEGCNFPIGIDTMELHHKFGRGAGKRCDCMACIQGLCKNATLTDGSMRPGCHHEAHRIGKLTGDFKRESAA